MAQLIKNPPAMPVGWEDALERGKATHPSILAWRIPWTVQSMRANAVSIPPGEYGRKVETQRNSSWLWYLAQGDLIGPHHLCAAALS